MKKQQLQFPSNMPWILFVVKSKQCVHRAFSFNAELSPASHSYVPSSFPSDHPVVLCCLVSTIIRVWFQHWKKWTRFSISLPTPPLFGVGGWVGGGMGVGGNTNRNASTDTDNPSVMNSDNVQQLTQGTSDGQEGDFVNLRAASDGSLVVDFGSAPHHTLHTGLGHHRATAPLYALLLLRVVWLVVLSPKSMCHQDGWQTVPRLRAAKEIIVWMCHQDVWH